MYASQKLKQHIITDNKMGHSHAKATIKFVKNENKQFTIKKANYLVIDVKVTKVDVLPTFVDAEGKLSNEDQFFNYHTGIHPIKGRYCRHPVPDIYVLKHHLLKGRDTKVANLVCGRDRPGLCPEEAGVGESYTRRIATKCNHNDATIFDNSKLYCSNYVNIAWVFGYSKSMFHDPATWQFKNKACLNLYLACKSCKMDKCTGGSDESACMKQCEYICRCYRKKDCVKNPLRCARGDLSELTLEAKFLGKDLSARFNCYLQRRISEKIFDITYRVRIPNTKLISKWMQVKSKQLMIDKDKIRIGEFEVKYHKGKLTAENIFLTGHRSTKSKSEYDLSIRNLKLMNKLSFDSAVDEIRFLPATPFAISTQKWTSVSNCKLLASWKRYFAKKESPIQDVKIEQINLASVRSLRHAYRISHKKNATKVSVAMNGSTTVLDKLAVKSSLISLNATLDADFASWIVRLRGNVSSCPAFLGISAVEATEMALVLKQDILILCPKRHFDVIAKIRKREFRPYNKARLFVAYVSDGTHTYETHMEKKFELRVDTSATKKTARRKKAPSTIFHVGMFSKFDPLIILTGCFILGLITLMIFSCLISPSIGNKAQKKGRQQAAIQLGRKEKVREELDNEDKLENRHLVPIVFLVTARVAYSFLLTASFISVIFKMINKDELHAISDFNHYIKLKINQSNQISLALDIFRETEVKIMSDRAAFLECACDYHMGKIMRNIRDNMTSTMQLHDLIAYDKISEMVMKILMRKTLEILRESNPKYARFEKSVKDAIQDIYNKVNYYSYRVHRNKHFSVFRSLYGAWNVAKSINYLGFINVMDSNLFSNAMKKIKDKVRRVRSMLTLAVTSRVKKAIYPITNLLLTPLRHMKQKVKQRFKDRIARIKNAILRKIPCLGDVDAKKWEQGSDEKYDEKSKNRCYPKATNDFIQKVVGDIEKRQNETGMHVIRSVNNDATFNILTGDAMEEQYEYRQNSKWKTLKKVAGFYAPSEHVRKSFRYLKKYSFLFIVVFDVLLITYRNLKTYRFAFMMAAGVTVLNQHKKVEGPQGMTDDKKDLSSGGQKMVGFVAKVILKFFGLFTFVLKLIFTSLIIPLIVFIVAIFVAFYLAFAFTYNGMNVDTLEELGAFKMLSSRLDINLNVTKQALIEQAEYVNKMDLAMYEDRLHAQVEEFRRNMEEFNAEEVIRIDRLKAELCDLNVKDSCRIDFTNVMEKLNVNIKPCVFPVVNARMPDNIYDAKAYRYQLKYELKHYVDALRTVILRTFYLVLAVIGTIAFSIIMAKLIFKFLKAMGMVRLKNVHVYEEIPNDIRKRYYDKNGVKY